VFHSSILGGLEICLVGTKPTKVPCGEGTGYQGTSFSKTVLPNHAKFIKMRATPFLSFSCWNDFFYDCKCRYTVIQSGRLRNSTAYRLAL